MKFLSRLYGIRRYSNGSSLGFHVDRPTTHVISAILQIDQVNVIVIIDYETKALAKN